MKLSKRILALTVSLIIILSAIPFAAAASEPADELPYYGYETLKTMPNSEALLYAYESLVAGVENCDARINVKKAGSTLTADDVSMVYDIYRRDHAEHFWLGDMANVSSSYVEPTYLMSKSELPAAKRAFELAVTNLLGEVDSIEGEFEKELYLHDRLINSVIYDLEADYMHSPYGAMVLGRAVCDGYSEAFQYLLRRAGIQSYLIYGSAGGVGHAWNAVRIDSKYYHVDATWNDQETYEFHDYFNLTTSVIDDDHTVTATEYPLPVCDSTNGNYFTVKGGKISSAAECTAQYVGQRLEQNGYFTSFYLDGTMSAIEFGNWFSANFGTVLDNTNAEQNIVDAISANIIPFTREVIVYIGSSSGPLFVKPTGITVDETLSLDVWQGRAISISAQPEGVFNAEIVYTSSNESVAVVNSESGYVIAKKPGTATVTVSIIDPKTKSVVASDSCTVVVDCEHENKENHPAGTSTCKKKANAEYYTCNSCGQILAADGVTELASIPKLPLGDHDFKQIASDENIVSEGDCQTPAIYCESCSVCGEKDTDATFEGALGDHDHGTAWESNEDKHWHECACGDKADLGDHLDADRNGECDDCGFNVGIDEETTTGEITTVPEAPETTPSGEVTTAPKDETTAPEEVTTEPEATNEPENSTTEKPDGTTADQPSGEGTSAPDETEATPEVTDEKTEATEKKEPSKTEKPTENGGNGKKPGGCGSISLSPILAFICAAAVTVIVKKK